MEYGKDQGSVLADEVVLRVFGKQVYQRSLAHVDVDCSDHTHSVTIKDYPGFSVSHVDVDCSDHNHSVTIKDYPGFSVSHTLWVGPFPVTFLGRRPP